MISWAGPSFIYNSNPITISAVFKFCWFSLFLKDLIFQIIYINEKYSACRIFLLIIKLIQRGISQLSKAIGFNNNN